MPGNNFGSFKGSVSDLPSSSDLLTFWQGALDDGVARGLGGDVQTCKDGHALESGCKGSRKSRPAIFLMSGPKSEASSDGMSTKRPCGVPYRL